MYRLYLSAFLPCLIPGLFFYGYFTAVAALADDAREGAVRSAEEAAAAMEGFEPPERVREAAGQARNRLGEPVNEIADESMAREWEALREALDLERNDRLYIFVSTSMPEPMIREYALDAARAGGALVFRGVTEGDDLMTFLRERVMGGVMQDTATPAPIQIDPRLFDVYDIQRVPSIVVTPETHGGLCADYEWRTGEAPDGETVQYQGCPEDAENYWQMDGAVNLHWALEQAAREDAPAADRFLAAWRDSFQGEDEPEREMDIEGHDPDAWASRARELAREASERTAGPGETIFETEVGPSVGPDWIREEVD